MPHEYPDHPRVGVGVIVRRGDAVLLVRRGKPPGLGEWSLPGGSQELGETLFETAAREALEETGVTVRPVSVLTGVDNIERDANGRVRFHYTIVDYCGRHAAGDARPGDDVSAIAWALPEELPTFDLTPDVLRVIARARC